MMLMLMMLIADADTDAVVGLLLKFSSQTSRYDTTNFNVMSLGADRCLYRRSKAHNLRIACEHNGCVEALSSIQRDAVVLPKLSVNINVMK